MKNLNLPSVCTRFFSQETPTKRQEDPDINPLFLVGPDRAMMGAHLGGLNIRITWKLQQTWPRGTRNETYKYHPKLHMFSGSIWFSKRGVCTHTIHVRYIYLHLPYRSIKCRQICHTWMLFGIKHTLLYITRGGRKLLLPVNMTIVVRVSWKLSKPTIIMKFSPRRCYLFSSGIRDVK